MASTYRSDILALDFDDEEEDTVALLEDGDRLLLVEDEEPPRTLYDTFVDSFLDNDPIDVHQPINRLVELIDDGMDVLFFFEGQAVAVTHDDIEDLLDFNEEPAGITPGDEKLWGRTLVGMQ